MKLEWLPMSSAPKDQTAILVTVHVPGYAPFLQEVWWDNCYGETDYCWCEADDTYGMRALNFPEDVMELWGWMHFPEPAEGPVE